jgi:hypothetical protein
MVDPSLIPIKVNVEHKKEITQVVPEDVTRARNSAWLDIISPITEWAGLKGDTLRHKRDLMRLEQEASLLVLSQKLRQRLDGQTITPIPTKQLIPALEKASLEPPDSEFLDQWANLLASAAKLPGDDVSICTSILSEIGPNEATLLEVAKKRLADTGLWPEHVERNRQMAWREFIAGEYEALGNSLADNYEGKLDGAALSLKLADVAKRSPYLITSYQYGAVGGGTSSFSSDFSERQFVAIDVLKYRNLMVTENYFEVLDLRRVRNRPFRGTVTVNYFYLTHLAIAFLRRVSDANSSPLEDSTAARVP